MLSSLVLFGCINRDSKAVITPTRLKGINGECIYMIDRNSNEVIRVIKDEFVGKPNYHVDIRKDTLLVGETFKGFVGVFKSDIEIKVSNPIFQQVVSENSDSTIREFQFSPKSVGVYNFEGEITYDTVVVPFQYKFIVSDK